MRLIVIIGLCLLIIPVLAEAAPYVYEDHGNRDPFWPLVSDNGSIISYETDFAISDLVLEGIMAGAEGSHVAMINGRIVTKGDQLGNFFIEDVQPESVIVIKDNLKFELKLEKED